MRNGVLQVGPKGGQVTYHRGGEVTRCVILAPGEHSCKPFMAAREAGEEIEWGAPIVATRARLLTIFQGRVESAANPSWRMSEAARMARDIRNQLLQTQAYAKRAEKAARMMRRAKTPPPAVAGAEVGPASEGGENAPA